MRVVVLGVGAAGGRAARQLASSAEVSEVVVCDREPGRADEVARSLGPVTVAEPWRADLLAGADGRVEQHGGFDVRDHGFHRVHFRNQVGGDAPYQRQARIRLRIGCKGQDGHMRARLGDRVGVVA